MELTKEIKIRISIAVFSVVVGFVMGQSIEKRSYEREISKAIATKVFTQFDEIKKADTKNDD